MIPEHTTGGAPTPLTDRGQATAESQAQAQTQAPAPAQSEAPAEAAPHASPLPQQARPRKPRPRTGPIVWGALMLVFCAYVAVRSAGGSIDSVAWLITTIIGLGAILLIVGVAVLVRGSRERE